jgi:speckle-type POZ protein
MDPVPALPESPSTTVVKLDNGCHDFKIIGYSSSRGIGAGKYITSQIFTVGGHHWCLRYYPDGYEKDERGEYISIFIESVDTACDVKALFDIRLLHSVSGALSPSTPEVVRPHVFRTPSDTWGFYQFMRKKDLEASDYLRDDCFTIRCHVVVIKELSEIIGSLANASINQPD